MAHSERERRIMFVMTIFALAMGMIIGIANDYSDWGTVALMLSLAVMVPFGSIAHKRLKKRWEI